MTQSSYPKVNFYEVAWGWYEEYDPRVFYSSENHTQSEFDELVKKLVDESAKEIVSENPDGWIGNTEIVGRVWKKLSLHGFHEVEFVAKYNMWGSSIIDSDDKEYKDYISMDVLSLIIKHNEKIRGRLYQSSPTTTKEIKE